MDDFTRDRKRLLKECEARLKTYRAKGGAKSMGPPPGEKYYFCSRDHKWKLFIFSE